MSKLTVSKVKGNTFDQQKILKRDAENWLDIRVHSHEMTFFGLTISFDNDAMIPCFLCDFCGLISTFPIQLFLSCESTVRVSHFTLTTNRKNDESTVLYNLPTGTRLSESKVFQLSNPSSKMNLLDVGNFFFLSANSFLLWW